ncbi:MAG: citryl-CoA lyase [Armatimonadetes bacterium]|nr:citryl-CoA lyase [Armatimonadota bacterium]
MTDQPADPSRAWWRTAIIDIAPGQIGVRGYAIEQLIGSISFPAMIWLLLRGELPSPAQAALLEAALVASVDHGPQAPSIAIARMSVTCGLPLNNAVASGINSLGDVHGGAGQQCMEMYEAIAAACGERSLGEETDRGAPLEEAVRDEVERASRRPNRLIPGFGHRFHPVDPRAVRLLAMVDQAARDGVVAGRFARIGRAVEAELERRKGRRIPMNIDGVTAVVFCELGFPPPLGRGLFVLSRAAGILAHAWEQSQQGERIKGPVPPEAGYTYTGVPRRDLPGQV